nr:MAG TPA: hypothetical protein [Caudoviricetes sp.]
MARTWFGLSTTIGRKKRMEDEKCGSRNNKHLKFQNVLPHGRNMI